MTGQTFGHYRILNKIGAGGMGEVYRARDEHLVRDVAIKILPAATLADEAARHRFRKEAEALSKLNHPNIATVYDFDTQDGVDFLVMEFVAGESLAHKLKAGSLPEKQSVELGEQLASALENAHEHGVIHRDLKPGNVMVTPKGQPKILDFGLAVLLRPASEDAPTVTVTHTEHTAGTLPYMTPEQLRGEPADARTDIHALGAMLYEMATGRRPFEAKLSTALAADIQNKPPQPPRSHNARLSGEIERIILKCLEKDPASRFQSAKEVVVDLRRLRLPSTGVRPLAQRASKPPRVLAFAGVVMTVFVGLLALDVGGLRSRLFSSGRVAPKIESIAVLPLKNLMGDPEQGYFVEGMHEALITELSKISALKVISRTSTMRYKDTDKAMPRVAQELNVDAVIEGSVLREGEQVRITVQLIHGRSDRHLWAQSFDRELRSVLALQSEVAREIAAEIEVKLTPQEQVRLATARPVNPEAYEAYLKGRYYSNKFTEEGINRGIEYFHRSIEIDPAYGLAYAGLADAYYGLSNIYLPPKKVMPRAEAAAIRAVALDDTLAEAHTSLGMVRMYYDWNWLDAEREFKRAIGLNPNYAIVHLRYGILLTQMGRSSEAIAELKWAQRLDPFSIEGNALTGLHFICARQYEQAVDELQKAIEIEPNSWMAHDFLGSAYELRGELAEAIAEFQKARRLDDNPTTLAKLGHAYLVLGKRGEGIKILNQLKHQARQRYVSPFFIAILYMGLGDKDQAFEWLEKTYEDRNEMMGWLKVDPLFDPLRSDPRYQDLQRRMNFPP